VVARAFDYEVLWVKAMAFINRALDSSDEFEECAFWAACSLELLAKAALTRINPALIADIERGGNSLLIAAGLQQDSSSFVTIQAKTVFTRCKAISRQFDTEVALRVAGNRNNYIHSGGPLCAAIPEQRWWEDFWPLVSILLAAQERDLADFVGDDRESEVQGILARSEQHARERFDAQVERAKLTLQRRLQSELTPPEVARIRARTSNRRSFASAYNCPVCDSSAQLRGDDTAEVKYIGDVDDDDHYVGLVNVVNTDEFACGTCGLVVTGPDAVDLADLPEQFEVEDDGPDYEPEYGND
jgi:hypothetical protein